MHEFEYGFCLVVEWVDERGVLFSKGFSKIVEWGLLYGLLAELKSYVTLGAEIYIKCTLGNSSLAQILFLDGIKLYFLYGVSSFQLQIEEGRHWNTERKRDRARQRLGETKIMTLWKAAIRLIW